MLWNIKGLSLQTIGNIKESIQCFLTAININSANVAARNNLGNSYKYANQYNLAQECFDECIKRDPNYTASIVNLANLKVIINDYEGAIKLYKNVLKNNENIESVYINLAQAYQSTKDFKKSLDNYLEPFKTLSSEERKGWVAGLGHGVLPKTPEDNVKYYVDRVREVFSK